MSDSLTPLNPPLPDLSPLQLGSEDIYDDGIFRIYLPSQMIPELVNGSLHFHIEGLPFHMVWTTMVVSKPELEQINCPSETLAEVMRFLMPDLSPDEPMKPIFMASGFHMGSHECVSEGECRSSLILAAFADERTFLIATLEVTAPEAALDDIRLNFLRHHLRKSVRCARCSIGEPRINSSFDWLYVPKIQKQFPEVLGAMIYQYATDYESTAAGEGISLRYADGFGRKADIYIYDSGEDFIETGAETAQGLSQMEVATHDMEAVCHPNKPEILRDSVSSFGRQEIPFLDRRFLVTSTGPEHFTLNTAILISAQRGAFIKIRFTILPGENKPRHPLLDALMNDLADVLSL